MRSGPGEAGVPLILDVDRLSIAEIHAHAGHLARELKVHRVASVADAEAERTDVRRQHRVRIQTVLVKLYVRVTPVQDVDRPGGSAQVYPLLFGHPRPR